MAHRDVELPRCFKFGAEGGAVYDTQIAQVLSGFEFRNRGQEDPLREYSVSFPARLKSHYDALIDWFEVIAEGRANSWLLVDPFDYQVSRAQGVLTSLGESPDTSFQTYKRRTVGAYTKDRRIQKLREGTITVFESNGNALLSGVSIEETTGIIDITSGTGPYTWAGEFCVPARFDSDPMKSVLLDKGRGNQFLIEWRSIPVKEVRLD